MEPVDLVMDLCRISIGAFFAISGFHKITNPGRKAAIKRTLEDDGVPFPSLNTWFVPRVEFLGGSALTIGFATPLAALGLFIICLVACIVDGIKRIPAQSPIDKADWLDDLLYLPEVLYSLMLVAIIANGLTPLTLDYYLW